MSDIDTLLVPTTTHGRVLIRTPAATAAGVLVGFHGYAEDAAAQLERLLAIKEADDWLLLSVQALHRFYRGRSQDVVAGWMTRQDRDAAIADNIAYVDASSSRHLRARRSRNRLRSCTPGSRRVWRWRFARRSGVGGGQPASLRSVAMSPRDPRGSAGPISANTAGAGDGR